MEFLPHYWLAGILEGEGTFMSGPPSEPNSPIARICIPIATLWHAPHSYSDAQSLLFRLDRPTTSLRTSHRSRDTMPSA